MLAGELAPRPEVRFRLAETGVQRIVRRPSHEESSILTRIEPTSGEQQKLRSSHRLDNDDLGTPTITSQGDSHPERLTYFRKMVCLLEWFNYCLILSLILILHVLLFFLLDPLESTSQVVVVPVLSGWLGAGLSEMASPTTGSASNLPISFLQIGAVPPLLGGPTS